jgi:hypothetical protein
MILADNLWITNGCANKLKQYVVAIGAFDGICKELRDLGPISACCQNGSWPMVPASILKPLTWVSGIGLLGL